MSVWFNSQKSINVIYHINKLEERGYMILSRDAGKAFDKIQHPFMIKTFFKLSENEEKRTEGDFLNLIKNIYRKPIFFLVRNYMLFP